GPSTRGVDDDLDGMPLAQRPARRRELSMAETLRPVRLGGRLDRLDQRSVAAEGDLDVGPAGELEDGPGVALDLMGVDVAADACDGDELGLRRGRGVQDSYGVVD